MIERDALATQNVTHRRDTILSFDEAVEGRAAAIDKEAGTVEFSFSSEEPYERWDGIEILGHGAKEIDLSWLKKAGVLLLNHDTRELIGAIESVEIDESARKCRCVARFSKSPAAQIALQDVIDRIRRNVSVGYEVIERKILSSKDGIDTYRVTKWRPLEVSLVSIPADRTVGVGRAAAPENKPKTQEEKMDKDNPTPTPASIDTQQIARDAANVERKRMADIMALGKNFKVSDSLIDSAIREGVSVDGFRAAVLEEIGKRAQPAAKGLTNEELGLTEKEKQSFSLTRALSAMMSGQNWAQLAPFEFEVTRAAEKRSGRATNGIYVPRDLLIQPHRRRDMTVGASAQGGSLVGTDLQPDNFIDRLIGRMMVQKLGATVLSGLRANVALPKLTGGAVAYWTAEGATVAESTPSTGSLLLAPQRCASLVEFSKQLLLQGAPSIDALLMRDIERSLSLAFDLAALHGSGAGGEPTGIAATLGIGSVEIGPNGGAPAWDTVVKLESAVANANADVGKLGYLSNPKVRGKLKTTSKDAGSGQFVWPDLQPDAEGMGYLNGYRAGATSQVRSNLTKGASVGILSAIFFGNWEELILAQWGDLEVELNPYTKDAEGLTRIVGSMHVAVGLRHPESMAACIDVNAA